MRLWLGVATFLVGATLLFLATPALAGARAGRRPAWVQHLRAAMGALGIAVLASTRPGLGWSVSSICFSLIAIILLATVLRAQVRR